MLTAFHNNQRKTKRGDGCYMNPILVDHEGRPLVPDTPKLQAPEVEEHQEDLTQIAQREAHRQSTVAHKKVNE